MRMSLCSFCCAKSYTKPYGKWNFWSNGTDHQNYLSHSVRRLLEYFSTLPAVHRSRSTKNSPVKADGCVITFLSAYHLSCILCFFLTLSRSPTLSQLVVIRGEVLWEFEGGGLWPDSSMHHQFTLSLLQLIAPLRSMGWGGVGGWGGSFLSSPNSNHCIIKVGLLYLAAAAVNAWRQWSNAGPGWWSECRVGCNLCVCVFVHKAEGSGVSISRRV